MEKEPAGDWWYGIGVDVIEGVYRKWSTAKAQVHRYSGVKVKKFKSAILADESRSQDKSSIAVVRVAQFVKRWRIYVARSG